MVKEKKRNEKLDDKSLNFCWFLFCCGVNFIIFVILSRIASTKEAKEIKQEIIKKIL